MIVVGRAGIDVGLGIGTFLGLFGAGFGLLGTTVFFFFGAACS